MPKKAKFHLAFFQNKKKKRVEKSQTGNTAVSVNCTSADDNIV